MSDAFHQMMARLRSPASGLSQEELAKEEAVARTMSVDALKICAQLGLRPSAFEHQDENPYV